MYNRGQGIRSVNRDLERLLRRNSLHIKFEFIYVMMLGNFVDKLTMDVWNHDGCLFIHLIVILLYEESPTARQHHRRVCGREKLLRDGK
jgi:hypothetical protein